MTNVVIMAINYLISYVFMFCHGDLSRHRQTNRDIDREFYLNSIVYLQFTEESVFTERVIWQCCYVVSAQISGNKQTNCCGEVNTPSHSRSFTPIAFTPY